MPAVGMRRSTRVFGVVTTGADSGRVLRSGRQLWPEQSVEAKAQSGDEGGDLLKPHKVARKDVVSELKTKPEAKRQGIRGRDGVDWRFGIVYTRKRRRVAAASASLELSRRNGAERGRRRVLAAVVRPCAGKSGLFSSLLFSVLRYIAVVKVTLKELSAFFLSEPVHGAFESRGVQFLQGPPTANVGICQFFGITQFMPMFCVDFTAIPLYFQNLHSAKLLKFMFRSFYLVNNPNVYSDYEDVEVEIDFPEHQSKLQISCYDFKREPSDIGSVTLDAMETDDGPSLHSSVRGTRVAGRNGQYRNIINLRSIQKRRSSLRKRKARSSSTVSLQRCNGVLASDLFGGRKSNCKRRSLRNVSTAGNLRNASSAKLDSAEGLGSSLCSANILVTDSDQCYRVEGAVVTLEMSASREWLLTVKKNGLTRCSFKAEKVMPPCSSNRLTQVITFSFDNRWKLEFANRQEWAVFKDLYKECSDRNIAAPVAKFIPVPGVHEVSSYAEDNSFRFHRPDTYISVYGDEVTRAMTRSTANYDMDSEDQEWLSSKFNNEFQEHVSEDNFELIIDTLEKAYYSSPDDSFDKESAVNACQNYGSKEVVEAVFTYWMSKRKQQKRSLLIKVFQGHQLKRAPLIPKPLLRKKRSFKRQPSQFGRSNQPSVLKAIAAEQDALEESAVSRMEEAKAALKKAMEIAIEKRKRAQALAENADLATYKATMLIRIAEAAALAAEADVATGYFLD